MSKGSKVRRMSTRERVAVLLYMAEERGTTAAETRDRLGVHHGSASGALSAMHKAGEISRLSEKRDGYRVYVSNRFVYGRDTEVPSKASQVSETVADPWAA